MAVGHDTSFRLHFERIHLPGGVCDEGHSALDDSAFIITGRRFPAVLPHINEDGILPVYSMQDFWNKYFNFDEKKVAREQLFDLAWQKKLRREKRFEP